MSSDIQLPNYQRNLNNKRFNGRTRTPQQRAIMSKGMKDNDTKTSPYNLLRILNELPTIKNTKSAKSNRRDPPMTPLKSKTPNPGVNDYYDRLSKTPRTSMYSRTPLKPSTPRSRPDTTDEWNKPRYNKDTTRRRNRNEEIKSGKSKGNNNNRYVNRYLDNNNRRPKSKADKSITRYVKLPPIPKSYSYNSLKKQREAANDFLSVLRSSYPRYAPTREKGSNKLRPSRSTPVISRSRSVVSVNDHIGRHNFARLSLARSRSVSDVSNNNNTNNRSRSRVRQQPDLWTPRTARRSQSVNLDARSRPRTREKSRGPTRSRSTSIVDRRKQDKSANVTRSRSVSTTRLLKASKSKPKYEIKQTRASLARSQSLIAIANAKQAPPPSRSSRSRQRSLSQIRRGREHSIGRPRRTPSLPDLHRSMSRISLAAKYEEAPKKKLTPLFIAIKPENQNMEKEKFMKYPNFLYSPQFRYANPPSENQLGRFSRASDKYLDLAVKIMGNAINKFGTYEHYMEQTGGRKLSRFEITQAAKAYLQRENLESEVDIHLADDLLSRARMAVVGGRPTVIIRAVNMRENWVEGMLRHEIGTHYIRAWNNKLQKWGKTKTRQELSLEPANPTEEGLASIHSILFRKDPCLWRGALLYYTIYKASLMSFSEVFRDLGRFVKDTEVRWEYCIRAKRGYTDTSQPGAFCKDQVYLNGALQILKYRNTIDFPMLVKCGKVSWRDLEKLEKLDPELQLTRIPKFMDDLETYKAELSRILTQNGITQEDLDLI